MMINLKQIGNVWLAQFFFFQSEMFEFCFEITIEDNQN